MIPPYGVSVQRALQSWHFRCGPFGAFLAFPQHHGQISSWVAVRASSWVMVGLGVGLLVVVCCWFLVCWFMVLWVVLFGFWLFWCVCRVNLFGVFGSFGFSFLGGS